MTPVSEIFRIFPQTVDRLLELPLKFHPQRIAVETDDSALSYAQLAERIETRGAELGNPNAARFERWGLAVGNRPVFLEWLFALSRAGCVVLPLPPDLEAEQFESIARKMRLSGSVTALGARRLEWADEVDRSRRPSLVAAPIDVDPAIIVRTSGSLGPRRGIVLEHHAVLANVIGNIRALGLRDTDKTLVVLPLTHAYALVNQALSHLAIGATVCLPSPPLAPPLLVRALDRFKITTLAAVPPVLEMLLTGARTNPQPLPALRLVSVGAAYTPPRLVADFRARFPAVRLAITYGLTEAGPRVSTRFVGAEQEVDTTGVGMPLPNSEISIRERDDGREEVYVRSRSIMRSYADDPYEEGNDHSLATSDVGDLREGGLYLKGRLERSINRAGRRIAAESIEHVLLGDARVRAARVEAQSHPFWGEVPVAHVYVDDENLGLAVDDLSARCRRELETEDRPERIVVHRFDADALTAKQRTLLGSTIP
jgi:long-chain acyl-CoA synthetase